MAGVSRTNEMVCHTRMDGRRIHKINSLVTLHAGRAFEVSRQALLKSTCKEDLATQHAVPRGKKQKANLVLRLAALFGSITRSRFAGSQLPPLTGLDIGK